MPDTPRSTSPPTASASKRKVFLRRLFSFIVLWTIVLTALFSSSRVVSDYVFLVIMVFLAITGLAEFYGLVQRGRLGVPPPPTASPTPATAPANAVQDVVCFERWGIFGGVLLMVGTFFNLTGVLGTSGSPARVNDFETSFLILFVLGLCLRQFFSRSNTTGILAISTTLFGLMYVPWLLNFIQKINFFPRVDGHYYLLYFVLITKFSDSGAYAVGSLLGRHKMIPRISPGKTWEGFAGAIGVSILASYLFVWFFRHHMAGMTWGHSLILGAVLGVSAVVGDLIESIFKREAGVKDSGRFFPGIGGILDLLDSLLFNAPIMYLYLRHVLTR